MEEQNRDELLLMKERRMQEALRGGLQGRMEQAFCLAQNSFDALESELRNNLAPVNYRKIYPFIEEMSRQLQYLERLSTRTANLTLSAALNNGMELDTVELLSSLREICTCASEELAAENLPATISFEVPENCGAVPAQVNWWGLNMLLVNLFSNSVKAQPNAKILLRYTGENRLLYQDNGPGLSEMERMQLLEGHWEESLANSGGIGLLTVRECAKGMGWEVCVREGEGLQLEFALPAPMENAELVLNSGEMEKKSRLRRTRHWVQQELTSLQMPGEET